MRARWQAFFSVFSQSLIEIIDLSKTDNIDSFDRGEEGIFATARGAKEALIETKMNVLSYLEVIHSFPRITIQFNKARRRLIEGIEESLKMINEFESGIDRVLER